MEEVVVVKVDNILWFKLKSKFKFEVKSLVELEPHKIVPICIYIDGQPVSLTVFLFCFMKASLFSYSLSEQQDLCLEELKVGS